MNATECQHSQYEKNYRDIVDLLRREDPHVPIYCIYRSLYRETSRQLVEGFPGRVLYAVKANNHPDIIRLLHDSGIHHFDCASVEEIRLVRRLCPKAEIYFMNPVRFEGDAAIAQEQFGVNHFVVDDESGLEALLGEIDVEYSVVFARMAVSHASAVLDLSSKFGAAPAAIPGLLGKIRSSGAEPALAFNVGTSVRSPEAYTYALNVARDCLADLPFRIRLVDIGGGFPRNYPGFEVPDIQNFMKAIQTSTIKEQLVKQGELMAEPGRALSAPGLSALTRVLLRKENKIFLNDGMYGAFWELRFQAHLAYPHRVFRRATPLQGKTREFRVFGPTCDSSDELPSPLHLPADIAVGDHIEFGNIGAYSLSGRTDFNGFYSDQVVSFEDKDAKPPTILNS